MTEERRRERTTLVINTHMKTKAFIRLGYVLKRFYLKLHSTSASAHFRSPTLANTIPRKIINWSIIIIIVIIIMARVRIASPNPSFEVSWRAVGRRNAGLTT